MVGRLDGVSQGFGKGMREIFPFWAMFESAAQLIEVALQDTNNEVPPRSISH